MSLLAENSYGKSRVRLVKVKRHSDRHDFREWTVQILLEGDFESCFVEGDNSKILPTDTMKNTVYSLARNSSAECMEDFGKELIAFLLDRNPQVSAATVAISEKTWEHLRTGGKPHPTTFVQSSGECQTAEVSAKRNGALSVQSGLEDLVILKTADSAFVGYIKDRSQPCRRPRIACLALPFARGGITRRAKSGFRGVAAQNPGHFAGCVCRSCQQIRATHFIRNG